MSEEAPFWELIGKSVSGNISGEERQQLQEWAQAQPENTALLEEMSQIWELSSGYVDAPLPLNTQQAWNRLETALSQNSGGEEEEQNPGARIRRFTLRRWRAIAAAIGVLAVGLWFFRQENALLSNPKNWEIAATAPGEQKQIDLPDGSRVWLNADSRLEYHPDFKKRRQIRLEGEAFFEVKRMEDTPFSVQTRTLKTIVLGTSFNIRAYPEDAEILVSVRTGVVQLETKTSAAPKTAVVKAGASGVFKPLAMELKVTETTAREAGAWKEGYLQFDGVPMAEVALALERHFNISIRFTDPALASCTFHGSFEDPDLNEVLQVLTFALDLDIQERDGAYEVSGKGCQ